MGAAARSEQWEVAGLQDKGDFLAGLLVGGLVGILVGLLVAPVPGDETRRRIARHASEAGDRVRDGAVRTATQVRGAAGSAAEMAGASAQAVGRRVAEQFGSLIGGAGQGADGVGPGAGGDLGQAAAAAEDAAGPA
jgi:gas vesicle protein